MSKGAAAGTTPPVGNENPPPPVYENTPPEGHAQHVAAVSIVTSTVQVIHKRTGPGVFLGKYPCVVFCQNCGCHVTTRPEYISGRYTILLCLIIFFCGCGLGCCLIPMFMNSCKDVLHHCPVCGQVIGFHRRV
ncbi:hypothetical protein V1264_003018 [Littorina saxatilis]|uniref:LITAF domain-containing protein n=1 Tax=Littorina saxatilis TaxID=31220 RepID=A0AAN9B3U9_9CAEN